MSNTHEWIELGNSKKILVKKDRFIPNNFGKAPAFHSDYIAPQRHPATGDLVESKTKWQAIDSASGTQTFFGSDAKQVAAGNRVTDTMKKERKKSRKADLHQSVERAKTALDNRMAPRAEHYPDPEPQVSKLIDSAIGDINGQ